MKGQLLNMFTGMSRSWEFVNLGRCHACREWDAPIENSAFPGGRRLLLDNNSVCRHAYLISRRGALRILSNPPSATLLQQEHGGDFETVRLLHQPYAISPRLFGQDRKHIKSLNQNQGQTIPEHLPAKFENSVVNCSQAPRI